MHIPDLEAVVALVFFGKDDKSRNGGSPTVALDSETGELVIQGYTVTDPTVLAEIDGYSRTAPDESSVRFPLTPHLRAVLLEALRASGSESA
ncbi:hypothetical protein [Streptosporangium saharense]|uniref:hypothetical protein n=1 Tax=Streptosporangium saharense TaxID=1706840 RepID=UPI0034243CAA